ncbi:hypothetical protein [Streptomyces sp. NRRL S-118]|nr:hypothetical protein [Streptomyces sp. NRRL S-118]
MTWELTARRSTPGEVLTGVGVAMAELGMAKLGTAELGMSAPAATAVATD